MDFVAIIILALVLGVITRLLFRGILLWVGARAGQKLGGGGPSSDGGPAPGVEAAFGLEPQFFALVQQMQRMQQMQPPQLQQLIQEAAGGRSTGSGGIDLGNLSPDIQARLSAQIAEAQFNMSAMDRLGQEQADLRRADMLGQASSAGIDVSNWRLKA